MLAIFSYKWHHPSRYGDSNYMCNYTYYIYLYISKSIYFADYMQNGALIHTYSKRLAISFNLK